MFIIIDLYSNNLNSLKNFKDKFKIFLRFYTNKTKTKKFAILKSPHVNKIAQEQFSVCLYKSSVILFSTQFLLIFYFIKNLKSNLFLDLNVKIKISSNNLLLYSKIKNCINPKKYIIEEFNFKSLNNYLKILESYGYVSLKNN